MTALLAVLGAFALVAVAPGPANLAVSLVAMARGPGPALRMALGLAVGLAVWGALAAAGLGAVLASSEDALAAMRLVGGGYLLWLALRSLRAAARPGRDAAPPGAARPFRAGLLLNLANPKAVLAWLAALSVGLGPASGAASLAVATAGCMAIGLANYVGWALVMSRAPVQVLYGRARRPVDAALAVLFGAAGAGLVREGLAR